MKAIIENAPRPYDLKDPREHVRLRRELLGYMVTSQHYNQGTDREGRQFAIDALRVIVHADKEAEGQKSATSPP